ncbi:MAG: holo-ACP synthase [Chlamydiota bacterium]
MNLDIGVDIVSVERIEQSIERYGEIFLKRIFTEKERAYCYLLKSRPTLRFASRYAGKEAVAKALGSGIGKHLSWQDIEILPEKQNKPRVTLSEKAYHFFNKPNIIISLSHEKEFAVAYALVQSRPA